MWNGLRIVYYHLVSNKSRFHYPLEDTISSKNIERQIKKFKKKYEIITINEAYKRYIDGFKFDKQLIITTDDGFEENYSVFTPILDKYGIKATHYLINNCIDNKTLMWRHALYAIKSENKEIKLTGLLYRFAKAHNLLPPKFEEDIMSWTDRAFLKNEYWYTKELWDSIMEYSIDEYLYKEKPYLSTSQIKELLNNGHEIGSHTKSHPNCDLLSLDELMVETDLSISELSERFEVDVISFSFPYRRGDKSNYLIQKNSRLIKVLLGTRENVFSNGGSPLNWERSNLGIKSKTFYCNFYVRPVLYSML